MKKPLTASARRLGLWLALATATLTGCSSQNVFTNQDPNADFSGFETYGFVQPLGTDDAEYDSLVSGYLKDAASRELESRGYVLGEAPDLLVNFHLASKERIRTSHHSASYGRSRRYNHWGIGYETTVTQYTEGTLTVDLVDRERNQLVWEANLVAVITDKTREDKRAAADQAIAEIFAEYPYVAGMGAPVADEGD